MFLCLAVEHKAPVGGPCPQQNTWNTIHRKPCKVYCKKFKVRYTVSFWVHMGIKIYIHICWYVHKEPWKDKCETTGGPTRTATISPFMTYTKSSFAQYNPTKKLVINPIWISTLKRFNCMKFWILYYFWFTKGKKKKNCQYLITLELKDGTFLRPSPLISEVTDLFFRCIREQELSWWNNRDFTLNHFLLFGVLNPGMYFLFFFWMF